MGVTVVVVSHDVKMLMNLSDTGDGAQLRREDRRGRAGRRSRRTPACWRPTLAPSDPTGARSCAVDGLSVSYGHVTRAAATRASRCSAARSWC
ncbi:MAG: hypothetical protein MZU95_04615 [Desulfomicrobium escambiense]|nr:hypothetical protein [Desulfomicrobium escambiense]